MATKADGPLQDTLREQLQQSLSEAQALEQKALAQLEEAKANLAIAKAEAKKLRAMIELYAGKTSGGSLTKKSVRPLVQQLLDTAPLPESEVLSALESTLRNQGKPLTGLALIIRSLRKDFADSDGTWRLPTSDQNGGQP
jgi:hypothetical protein